MTQSAPAAIALTMSPEVRMPPSAIAGTPCSRQAAAVSSTAVNCGTPTPATTRVVQMLPGPMPILTASAPASISARGAFGGGDVAGDDLHGVGRLLDPLDRVEHALANGRARCR